MGQVKSNLKYKRYMENAIAYFLIAISILVFLGPILYIISCSFKNLYQITTTPPIWFVWPPNLQSYVRVLTPEVAKEWGLRIPAGIDFPEYLTNSLIVCFGATGLAISVSLLAAYSMARWRTGGDNLRGYYLSLYMLPPAIFVVPLYILFKFYNLLDTQIGLILPYSVFNMPLAVLVLESFIRDLDVTLEEAAWIDGCSKLGTLTRITLPLIMPGIVATAILTFVTCWNEFMIAFLFTGGGKATTLTVGVAKFITGYGIWYSEIAAASTITLIPMIILFMLVQKYLVKGLTLGALKG